MSHHYPHHVGKIAPAQRANSERIAELASRYPGITEDEAKEIVRFLRTGRHPDVSRSSISVRLTPNRDAVVGERWTQFRANSREGAAVAGAVLVLLITAWLIWAAFAEAAAALG